MTRDQWVAPGSSSRPGHSAQKASRTASWTMRGLPALVIAPKLDVPKLPLGSP